MHINNLSRIECFAKWATQAYKNILLKFLYNFPCFSDRENWNVVGVGGRREGQGLVQVQGQGGNHPDELRLGQMKDSHISYNQLSRFENR
jgi:hypothetical protein